MPRGTAETIGARLLETDGADAILSVERTRLGFRVHYGCAESRWMFVSKGLRRDVEADLRGKGVVIVDEWGAHIDASQFSREEDPAFNRNVDDGMPSLLGTLLTPNWYLRYRHRRLVRQLSDDA